jgi:hypothetical protein
VSGLGGTGRLADDLYLMAHDEDTGKALLSARAVGLGLAGALLAELLQADSIALTAGGLAVSGPPPPGDALAREVAGLVLAETERHPVRDWLAFLGRTAAVDVAGRLAASGYLTGARRGRRGRRWVPADPDCAFAPIIRIRAALGPAGPVPGHGAALAGLATACGLGPRLAQYLPAQHHRRLDQAVVRRIVDSHGRHGGVRGTGGCPVVRCDRRVRGRC